MLLLTKPLAIWGSCWTEVTESGVVGKGEAEAVEAIEEGGFTTEDKDIVEAVPDITKLTLTIF